MYQVGNLTDFLVCLSNPSRSSEHRDLERQQPADVNIEQKLKS